MIANLYRRPGPGYFPDDAESLAALEEALRAAREPDEAEALTGAQDDGVDVSDVIADLVAGASAKEAEEAEEVGPPLTPGQRYAVHRLRALGVSDQTLSDAFAHAWAGESDEVDVALLRLAERLDAPESA